MSIRKIVSVATSPGRYGNNVDLWLTCSDGTLWYRAHGEKSKQIDIDIPAALDSPGSDPIYPPAKEIDWELLLSAQVNFETFTTQNPAVPKHPIYSIAKKQLDEFVEKYCK